MLKIKVFTFSPIQENTYVVSNEKNECLIIDPGCYFPEEQDELKMFINKNQLAPKMLLNTHCHLDHVFGNKYVSDTWKVPLHIHPKEKPVLDLAPASGLMFDLPFDNYSGEIKFLQEGEQVVLGNDILDIILAPGHSPGSICFYSEVQHFIISGDVLFYNSIGRTDLPMGDHDTLLQSIRQKIFVLPDDVTVYSGHGPETTIGFEKKTNPFVGAIA